MILIGFASFFLRFLVDRWAFARLYRTPPPYNSSIAKQARSVLPFASILHLIIGMWMYSNKRIFGSSSSSLLNEVNKVQNDVAADVDALEGSPATARLVQDPHLFVLLLLIVAWLVITRLMWRLFRSFFAPCIVAIFGGEEGEGNPLLSEAIEQGILTGSELFHRRQQQVCKCLCPLPVSQKKNIRRLSSTSRDM